MTEELKVLLDAARRYTPTDEEREEQRRSFAYGNTAFENALITRQMVNEEADKLALEQAAGCERL